MYEVSVKFLLKEDVTPDLFARQVGRACANQYAIKEGEAVELSNGQLLTFEAYRQAEIDLIKTLPNWEPVTDGK